MHFIRMAKHTVPTEIAYTIHDICGTCPSVSQVAALEDQVGRSLPQIGQDCLKRGSVAVDVGYDCDAHLRSRMSSFMISPISDALPLHSAHTLQDQLARSSLTPQCFSFLSSGRIFGDSSKQLDICGHARGGKLRIYN